LTAKKAGKKDENPGMWTRGIRWQRGKKKKAERG